MNESFVNLFILLALFLSACSKPLSYTVSGIIHEELRDDLLSYEFDNIEIDISSPGGKGGPSIQIAEYLSDKNVTLNVKGMCTSACSQVLLPIADSVNFIDEPLIGFHEDYITIGELINSHGGNVTECPILHDLYQRQKAILRLNNINTNFWRETDKRLIRQNLKLVYRVDDKCPSFDFSFKHTAWYPTSQQLREIYGLKFVGAVCADDYHACGEKIQALAMLEGAKENSSVVLGDKVYEIIVD